MYVKNNPLIFKCNVTVTERDLTEPLKASKKKTEKTQRMTEKTEESITIKDTLETSCIWKLNIHF